jgi:hypothetical protein
MPVRKDWVALKKLHNVPDAAVKGVKMGEVLEKIQKARTMPEQIAGVTALEKAAHTFITKLPPATKKSIKDYAKFEKTFLDKYLAPASNQLKKLELEKDKTALYKSELQKWFGLVQRLDAKKSQPQDCQTFTRYSRGLFSVSLRTKGAIDAEKINEQLTLIYDMDAKTNWAKATQEDAAKFVGKVLVIANQIRKLAKAQGLV